jgi:hypothetical protein
VLFGCFLHFSRILARFLPQALKRTAGARAVQMAVRWARTGGAGERRGRARTGGRGRARTGADGRGRARASGAGERRGRARASGAGERGRAVFQKRPGQSVSRQTSAHPRSPESRLGSEGTGTGVECAKFEVVCTLNGINWYFCAHNFVFCTDYPIKWKN